MYRDCVITAISDLSFYGKVLIWYSEKNSDKAAVKFILNKDKSVTGTSTYPNDVNIQNLNFNTIKELMQYLENIKDSIYLIEVA